MSMPRLRVCLVKQHTTYDLYTKTGPDLRSIVASSNWRTGPLGLWDAFDCDFRIVYENPDPECLIGKTHWSRYVEGWDIWPAGGVAEQAEAIDWGSYDIIISVDVAVPTHIVAGFPETMWCYYFIEGGPTGIAEGFRGSPYFGYNVFLDHRMGEELLTAESPAARQMLRERRAPLDFPYYFLSSRSVDSLYEPRQRSGALLSHQSRGVISGPEIEAFERMGPLRRDYPPSIAAIHELEVASKYFVLHPQCAVRAGTQVMEAISAGCVVLGPPDRLWGFPQLLAENGPQVDVSAVLAEYSRLEADAEAYAKRRNEQASRVDQGCYELPRRNMELLYAMFRESKASRRRQRAAEWRSRAGAAIWRSATRVRHLPGHLQGGRRRS
jgi:hypothetical protein